MVEILFVCICSRGRQLGRSPSSQHCVHIRNVMVGGWLSSAQCEASGSPSAVGCRRRRRMRKEREKEGGRPIDSAADTVPFVGDEKKAARRQSLCETSYSYSAATPLLRLPATNCVDRQPRPRPQNLMRSILLRWIRTSGFISA